MKKIIFYAVSISILLLVVNAIWPYMNKYFITADLRKAALYGTKHSIPETLSLLNKSLKDRGLKYDPEKLNIDKDQNKTVRISLSYDDEINILGITLKELQFKISVKEEHLRAIM